MGYMSGTFHEWFLKRSSEASYIDVSTSDITWSFLYPLILIFHCSLLPGCVLSFHVRYEICNSLFDHGTIILCTLEYQRLFFTKISFNAKPPLSVSLISTYVLFIFWSSL